MMRLFKLIKFPIKLIYSREIYKKIALKFLQFLNLTHLIFFLS